MSDEELIKKLRYRARDVEAYESWAMNAAANHLEALRAENERLREAADKLADILDQNVAEHKELGLTTSHFVVAALADYRALKEPTE